MAAAGQDRKAHLRQVLRPYRAKADAFAVSLFTADCAMYAICTAAAAAHLGWFVRFLAGTAAGVLLALLFVVGPDACHGSFTSRRVFNPAIGRPAFLPTFTPSTPWALPPNPTPPPYTNLKLLSHDC